VASLPNLKNMNWKEALAIGCNSWHGKECDLLDPKGVFLAKSRVMAFDPRKTILEVIIGNDHVCLIILETS
jgi:hypothetical protein